MRRVAIIGAGWAGLAAAVRATEAGHAVTLFEMARTVGGRARSVSRHGDVLDNGQHILIGAYVQTLGLMRTVGVDPAQVLKRLPLALLTPDGRGLRLPGGAPLTAFARGVLGHTAWPWRDRLTLLTTAAGWSWRGFRCPPGLAVADLCAGMPSSLREELIDPLCVAALNTPSNEADAAVFLRVLKDALFSGRGSADLLLPRRPLGELLPEAAETWLRHRGAGIELGRRVERLAMAAGGWQIDETPPFDAVVLACTAAEASRLVQAVAPDWAAAAAALRYEPIVTVTLDAPGVRLVAPMVSLPAGPAQFAFDLGQIGAAQGRFSFVISGAAPWVTAGLPATERAVLAQARDQFPRGTWPTEPRVVATMAERRATFRCTPDLRRPPLAVAHGLAAAGDYVQGPYPATLEGAVRAGIAAADQVLR